MESEADVAAQIAARRRGYHGGAVNKVALADSTRQAKAANHRRNSLSKDKPSEYLSPGAVQEEYDPWKTPAAPSAVSTRVRRLSLVAPTKADDSPEESLSPDQPAAKARSSEEMSSAIWPSVRKSREEQPSKLSRRRHSLTGVVSSASAVSDAIGQTLSSLDSLNVSPGAAAAEAASGVGGAERVQWGSGGSSRKSAPESSILRRGRFGNEAQLQGGEDVRSTVSAMHGFVDAAAVAVPGRERHGWKKEGQDVATLHEKLQGVPETFFAGIFDGHGPHGRAAATVASIRLVDALESDSRVIGASRREAGEAISNAFIQVDQALGRCAVDVTVSGTTAVIAVIHGRYITCSWVGDSRAIVGRLGPDGIEAVALSNDHKPDNPGERARIESVGGRVAQYIAEDTGDRIGPFRVFEKYSWTPGLACSRSLGDSFAHQHGVSAEPETRHHFIEDSDRFMVLASDGVWEFMTNEEVAQMVQRFRDPKAAAEAVVSRARMLWNENEKRTVDDISVIVAMFDANHSPMRGSRRRASVVM
mmetsp:Transcript_2420/g.8893  ORF Transcript_2420/g.8893 Transcript_2420/m.8893 type:complete len:532 (+) Transcript_2420:2691-4286(+)